MKNVNELTAKAKKEEALDNVSDRFTRIKHDIEDAAHDAGRNLKNFYEDKRSELNEFADEFSATVRRKPIQATLAAAAVGFILGRLFR